jgi:lysophospholipase L1-like esterase
VKKFLFPSITALCLLATCSVWAQEQGESNNRLPPKSRVVFLGNSITYTGHYVHQFTTAALLNDLSHELEIINLGLPSETVSGLSEVGHADGAFPRPNLHDRLSRILDTLSPDMVIACYGINDGIYQPFSNHRFDKYVKGMEGLHHEVTRTGAKIIFLTPPVFDPVQDEEYADVMHRYANWLIQQRSEAGWEVIDIHWPMFEFLAAERALDPSFFLAEDGIHPGELGQWLMARELIKAFNIVDVNLPDDPDPFFDDHPKGKKVLALFSESLSHSRDYWLFKIGHQRPGLRQPMPEKEYWEYQAKMAKRISEIMKQIGECDMFEKSASTSN